MSGGDMSGSTSGSGRTLGRRVWSNGLIYGAALAAGFAAFALTGSVRGEDNAADAPQGVMTMDVDFLREKLMKIWIIEEASDRHNQRRIAQKSFLGMTPVDPTGDAEADAENRAAYLKNDKHLRHYLMLEYENAIEAIDIGKHTLGTHLRPPKTDAVLKAFLDQEIPEIVWRNKKLDAAMEDFGRKIGVTVEFGGIADNEDVVIDVSLPAGFQVRQALEYINNIHPIQWTYEDGKLTVRYMGGG